MEEKKPTQTLKLELTPDQLKALQHLIDSKEKGAFVGTADLVGSNLSLSYVAMNAVLIKRK